MASGSGRRSARVTAAIVLRAFLCFQVVAGQTSAKAPPVAQQQQQGDPPAAQEPPPVQQPPPAAQQQQVPPPVQQPPPAAQQQQVPPPVQQPPPAAQQQQVPPPVTETTTTTTPRPLTAAELAAQGAARDAAQKAEAERKRKEELSVLLGTAVSTGNKTGVDEALNKGADLAYTGGNGEGWSILASLAMNCNSQSTVDMVKYLISKGADVDQADNRGRTPLYHAARYNKTECVREFVKVSKSLSGADGDGVSAVTRAIWKGHTEIVQLIHDAARKMGRTTVIQDAEYHGPKSEFHHIRRLFGVVEEPPKPASTFESKPAAAGNSYAAGNQGDL